MWVRCMWITINVNKRIRRYVAGIRSAIEAAAEFFQ